MINNKQNENRILLSPFFIANIKQTCIKTNISSYSYVLHWEHNVT